jgi:hypothetical protein
MHDGGRESVKTEHNINKGGTHTHTHTHRGKNSQIQKECL